MTHSMLRFLLLNLAVATFLVAFQQTAMAGPPLICHPIEIGEAKSLPWADNQWRAIKKDYNINRLVDDTLALLAEDMPVTVRMETIRRATVYSVTVSRHPEAGDARRNLSVANELLSRLVARAEQFRGRGQAEALALFDAGYFAECYKQAAGSVPKGIDGYDLVVKAISLRGGDAEMEFAAAVIALHPSRPAQREHLQRAYRGAAEGSLLARNLASHFPNSSKTAKN